MPRTPVILAALVSWSLLSLAGCGGSTKAQHRTTTTTTPTTTTPIQPIQAAIIGENHNPVVNQPWRYTVTVTDAQGHKLSGTETTQYTFNGAVVGQEKPPNVMFTGVYRDTIEFPAAAVGYPLDVQAVVHTSLGSATVDWPVVVQR